METNVLERAAEIAKSNLEKIKAPEIAKQAEAKAKSDADNQKAEQAKREKDAQIASEADRKAKEDERILNTKDEELKDNEKAVKAELVAKKKKEEDTPEAKIKRVQEASQKRIDEIKSELLHKEDLSKKEMEKLRAEIEELKRPKKEEDLKSRINREMEERHAKFVEEDKNKPYEQRREMSKDELNNWYLEDPVEATKWIQRREYRVARELEKAEESAKAPVDNTDEKRRLANEFVAKQQESRDKLLKKYPSIVPSKEKITEIRNSLGLPLDRALNQDETKRFNDKFAEQSPEFRLCLEIVNENPKKYLEQVDGPELAMAEIEKRLGKSSSNGRLELTQEELDAKIEAEIERRRLADGEGSHSTNGGRKVETKRNNSGTSLSEDQLRVASKAKIGAEAYQKMLNRRESLNVPSASHSRGEDRD